MRYVGLNWESFFFFIIVFSMHLIISHCTLNTIIIYTVFRRLIWTCLFQYVFMNAIVLLIVSVYEQKILVTACIVQETLHYENINRCKRLKLFWNQNLFIPYLQTHNNEILFQVLKLSQRSWISNRRSNYVANLSIYWIIWLKTFLIILIILWRKAYRMADLNQNKMCLRK